MISYFSQFPRNLPGYGKAIRQAIEAKYGVAGCPFSAAKFMEGFRIGQMFSDSQVYASIIFDDDLPAFDRPFIHNKNGNCSCC